MQRITVSHASPSDASILQGLLGRDAASRERLLGFFRRSVAAYACASGGVLLLLVMGLLTARNAAALLAWLIGGQALFYALLRSAWGAQLSAPSLLMAQLMHALVSVALAYAACPPLRASFLVMAAMALVLGLFRLTPRQILLVCLFGVTTMGLTMLLLTHVDPRAFAPRTELLYFALITAALPCVAALLHDVTQLRDALIEDNARLAEALREGEHLARTDTLTGLHNRLHMQTLLNEEVARQRRHGGTFTVVLLDLDWFKQINDHHGHSVGDAVLQGLARTLQTQFRGTDEVARWGGEEFLVLLPGTSTELAQVSLRRLREHLMFGPLVEDHPDLWVNFSSGMAEHRPSETWQQTLERADVALYRAKGGGRGRDWVGR